MKPLQLALEFMDIFFSGENFEKLNSLLTDNFNFNGPFYQFDSAEAYITSLQADPPKGFKYEIIRSFENESSACLIYQFTKPGVCTPMVQLFEVKERKISKVLLVFDTQTFS